MSRTPLSYKIPLALLAMNVLFRILKAAVFNLIFDVDPIHNLFSAPGIIGITELGLLLCFFVYNRSIKAAKGLAS